jgi:hypothetical protein
MVQRATIRKAIREGGIGVFNVGDKITIDMEQERYRECTCDLCAKVKDDGYALITDIVDHGSSDVLVVNVIDKNGKNWGTHSFYTEGIRLFNNNSHIWEV